MKTKVLVTGGAGFLGSHLCEWLLKNDNDVLCIDNYSFEKVVFAKLISSSVLLPVLIECSGDTSVRIRRPQMF